MNIFRKFSLQFFIWLVDERKNYNRVMKRPIFQQREKEEKLPLLLKHAVKNTAYYKNKLPEISNKNTQILFNNWSFVLRKSVLKKDIFQVMDSSIIRNKVLNYKDNLTKNLLTVLTKDFLIPLNTGGSTGKPLRFYRTKKSSVNFLIQFLQCAKFHGWKEGEVFMVCMQEGIYSQISFLKKIMGLVGFPLFLFKEIDEATCITFIKEVNKTKPTIILSFPSYLTELANYLQKRNFKPKKKIRAILSGGEMLFDYQRNIIEKTFDTRVYNFYGSNEIGLMAMECKDQNGLHVIEESVLLENDKKGNILATTLKQYDLPLIKYETGDKGVIQTKKCSCGIIGKKLIKLEGRVEEYIINGKGKKVYASYLRQLLLHANEKFDNSILRAQFIQKKNRRLFYYIQLRKTEDNNVTLHYIGTRLKKDLKILIKGQIIRQLLPRKGKFKFLIREK